MISGSIIIRIIFLGFMVLIGWSLARSIYFGSVLGIILAVISLGASLYFLFLLTKMKAELNSHQIKAKR